MNRDSLLTLYVGRARGNFTEEETARHYERPVCKSRGGSPLMLGARSPGRWDPACSCGWRNASNNGRRAAESSWRDHRRGAVFEERRLAEGVPIFRVFVVHDVPGPEQPVREWRAIDSEEMARSILASDGGTGVRRYVERSSDGEKWERIQ